MALKKANAKEMPMEQAAFTAAWELAKKYRHIKSKGTDVEWQALASDIDSLCKRNKGTQTETLTNKLCFAVIAYLEEISKTN